MGKPVKITDRGKKWCKTRKVRTRPFRQRFLIVCEGERTEPNYFSSIRQKLLPHTAVVIEGSGMNTITLVREAIRLREKEKDRDHPYDQTWVVFDRDSFPPDHFDNAITMCPPNDIKAAYSNEAFELWYILHFEDRRTGMSRDEYKHCLSEYLGETYVKRDVKMYDKVNKTGNECEAIRRAKNLLANAQTPPHNANPCTTVFQLVEELNRFRAIVS